MSALNLYKSYNFTDKDPIIDVLRDLVKQHGGKSGGKYKRISEDSGVSAHTLYGWFDGKTKRPQFATVAAVMGALGYRMAWVLDDGERPADAAAQMEAARQHMQAALPKLRAAGKAVARPPDPERQAAAAAHIRSKLDDLRRRLPG